MAVKIIEKSEVDAYNAFERDAVFVSRESMKKIDEVDTAFLITPLDNLNNSVLVLRYEYAFVQFLKDYHEKGAHYAIGIALGFPPKCVEYFDSDSKVFKKIEDRRFVYVGSFAFTCHKTQVEYAVYYMQDKHGFSDEAFKIEYYDGSGLTINHHKMCLEEYRKNMDTYSI